jgi:hypothetical protein
MDFKIDIKPAAKYAVYAYNIHIFYYEDFNNRHFQYFINKMHALYK